MSRMNVALVGIAAAVIGIAGFALAQDPAGPPGGPPGGSRKDILFVKETLAKIKPGDAASADGAEKALVERGKPVLRPLQQELLGAAGEANREKSTAIANAIMQIRNNVDPRKAIWEHVKKQENYADVDVADKLRLHAIVQGDVLKNGRPMMFYVGRMRQGAVATVVPPPLSFSNVFAIDTSNKNEVMLITTAEGLKDCLAKVAAATAKTANECTRLCLGLAMELAQDGSYTFTIPADGVKVEKKKDGTTVGTGKAVVDEKTGSGQVEVTLTFGKDGKLSKVDMKKDLKPGMRPQ